MSSDLNVYLAPATGLGMNEDICDDVSDWGSDFDDVDEEEKVINIIK